MAHKSRWILQALVLSVVLNVSLIGVFFYFLIRDNPLHFAYRPQEICHSELPPIPAGLMQRLPSVEFCHLLELLKDERTIDRGFQVREVALGALATFHYFDVERGLGRGKLSKHMWDCNGVHFLTFPGLSSADFETLEIFAQKERWPLTTQGLFESLRQAGLPGSDPGLIRFFCHTPEFILYETLFARTQLPISKKSVLKLALEGGWEKFNTFAQQERECIDFSNEARQQVLLGAIAEGSKSAAYLLIITDFSFATSQLDDRHLAAVLDLLDTKTSESLEFVQTIASSSRIDPIRKRAVARISEYTGSPQNEVAGHFYEKPGQKDLRPVFRSAPPAAPDPAVHIVQEGESLWTISRKYQISIEALMEANQLQSSVIRPGKSLKIRG